MLQRCSHANGRPFYQIGPRYDTLDVQWDDEPIGMIHYHDYAKSTVDWDDIFTDYAKDELDHNDFRDSWDSMGCDHAKPWFDTAVWMDRMARIQRKHIDWNQAYNKPFSWTEFGLGGDWNDAYFGRYDDPATTEENEYLPGDAAGQHIRDWIWAGIFNKVSGCHWLTRYFWGDGGGRPSSGITHWDVFLPLRNFLEEPNHPVDMRGMIQESCYSEDDPVNTTPSIFAEVSDSSPPIKHPNVEIYAVRSTNKAYLYIKNMTNTWYYSAGFREIGLPTPAAQTSRIRIKGLDTGQTYIVEKWSTRQLAAPTSINYTWDGSDMTFDITLDATDDYAWAIKIYIQ